MAKFETLPGRGATTAEAIVEYRQKNSSFKNFEEMCVAGLIGYAQ